MAPRSRPAPESPHGEPATPRRRRAADRREPRRWWRYGLVVLGGVLLVNALAGERGYLEYTRLRHRLTDAQAQLAARRAENAELQRRIRQLKTDPVAIEREVRDQLGYAKPGEVVFTVRDAPAPADRPAPAR